MLARLLSPLQEAATGARLLRSLPALLHHPLSSVEARSSLETRLERREDDFLSLVQGAVFANPLSPYQALLRLAGCEPGDLRQLVQRQGLEGALLQLYRAGVYLTLDEYKGRRATVRGSTTLQLRSEDLQNPSAASHLVTRSSGSRGAPVAAAVDLRFIRDRAVNLYLSLEAHARIDRVYALWGVPGGAYMARLLEYSALGYPPALWFSQVDPAAPGLHARYRWSGRALRWGGILAGVPLPQPQYVALEHPLPIVRWMERVLRSGQTPHLHTFTSSAVRLCEAAARAGVDLGGARFTVTGEPITPRRLAAIRQSGAIPEPRYGTNECTPIGYGCLAPTAADDLHLFHDLYAVVQPESHNRDADPFPSGALLISTIRSTAPLGLINLSLGDQGILERRACGCPLERLGWATHLHTIRSFEKLTASGMTFPDTDVIRLLEEVLPARFGGGPTDYQLVEDETDDGHPRVRLLVDPAVQLPEPEAVVESFLAALGMGAGPESVMALQWRQAGLPRLERQVPYRTANGKVLHLHQAVQGRASVLGE